MDISIAKEVVWFVKKAKNLRKDQKHLKELIGKACEVPPAEFVGYTDVPYTELEDLKDALKAFYDARIGALEDHIETL